MSDLEELERRKRELELKRDIARLERNEKIANAAANIADEAKTVSAGISRKVAAAGGKTAHWSWWWVLPLTLFGIWAVVVGLEEKWPVLALIGCVFLAPCLAKMLKWR